MITLQDMGWNRSIHQIATG